MNAFTYTNSDLNLSPDNSAGFLIHFNSSDGTSVNQKHNFTNTPFIFLNVSAFTAGGSNNEARIQSSAGDINTSTQKFKINIVNNSKNTLSSVTVQVLVVGY